jgi:crotonobetainyl-CoA:carnitine CoA-transferase CaiB-like acyl-CoA transferase
LADISAFDVTAFWSRSGLAGQMTPLDGSPPIGRPGMGDHTTAISTALGVMTALLVRTRTGRGQLVESSLLRSGAYLIGFDLAEQLRRGETVGAQRRGSQGVLNSHFATAGGRWFFVWIGDPDRDWPLLCRLAGRADMAEDPRLSTVEARAAAAGDIMHALETGFARLTLEAVGAELDRNGLMWSPVQRASDAVEDPACADAGCFVEVDDGDGGAFRAPAAPVGFPGAESARKGAVPAPGQHTDAVLAQMGYSAADVAALRRLKAVA